MEKSEVANCGVGVATCFRLSGGAREKEALLGLFCEEATTSTAQLPGGELPSGLSAWILLKPKLLHFSPLLGHHKSPRHFLARSSRASLGFYSTGQRTELAGVGGFSVQCCFYLKLSGFKEPKLCTKTTAWI